MKNDWKTQMKANASLVENALADYLKTPDEDLSVLYEAMRQNRAELEI